MSSTTLQQEAVKKILIVEDEGEMCLLLNILLNEGNIELDHVKNLQAAGEYLQKENPRVVILDNQLPDGFGVDMITFIKRHYPSIKIIMISGFDGAAKDVALENGADYYLEKPFTKAQLLEKINTLIG